MIRWPVSFGEAADRLSILQIKHERIRDPRKLANVEMELVEAEPLLREHVRQTTEFQSLFARLKEINRRLWDIEENIRQHERTGDFGPEFVVLARSVYTSNDDRYRVKREIDRLMGSAIPEEKSYSDVECSERLAHCADPAQD
jgi:hypothetical protein